MFTLYRIAVAPGMKTIPVEVLLTHKKQWLRSDFLHRSEAAPRRSWMKMDRHRSNRFVPLFAAVWTGIRALAEVNEHERGLWPTKRKVNIQKWETTGKSSRPTTPLWCSDRRVWTTCSSSVSSIPLRCRPSLTGWVFMSIRYGGDIDLLQLSAVK